MKRPNFWRNWKKKTAFEEKAINTTIKAKDKVINAIPKDKLIAIYIKGSFARRELRKSSDVDMVPIVAENKYESAVFAVNGPNIKPVMIVPLSLWEFKHNKLWTKGSYKPDLRAEPDLFLKKLCEYKLIYGAPIDITKYPKRSNKQIIKDEIIKIRHGYVPAYKKGKTSFASLLKELFWLVELVQNVKGKKTTHSFKGIAQSIKDKNHIIHKAYQMIINTNKNIKNRKQFLQQLEKYLAERENFSE